MSRPFVQLYIDHQLVSFQEPPKVLMTYQHIDLHNPTVVKNSFSKTVTVEGTPENNRIFGCFYDMTRINGYDNVSMSGAFFNPSKKVPFELYRNGEIMEQGYVKLDKVQKKKGRITYDITLFGGLGEFLYALKYKEDGEQMKLSDLDFGVDFDMEVTKDVVADAWRQVTDVIYSNDLYELINFAPCYNGIPENFTADKVAIEVDSFMTDLRNQFEVEKDGYTTENGWLIGELKKECDEWQTKDLRSYLQRPVIRFKEIVKACCNPENNGGYTVDLDEEFFNNGNEYYENAWMTLPLITEVEGSLDSEVSVVPFNNRYYVEGGNAGDTIKVKMKISPYITSNANTSTIRTGAVWQKMIEGSGDITGFPMYNEYRQNMGRFIQLVVRDKNGKAIGGSAGQVFTTNISGCNTFNFSYAYESPTTYNYGAYKHTEGNVFTFENSTYDFEANVRYEEGMYFEIFQSYNTIPAFGDTTYSGCMFDDNGNGVGDYIYNYGTHTVDALMLTRMRRLTKKTLLNSENSPCDYFLSFLKMFNLHIWKDMYDKIIYVRLRKNYFNGVKYDIEDLVDRESDIVITPLTFENKWLLMQNDIVESKMAKEYKNSYGFNYGIKKIDTNYNFDSSSKDVFDNNVFSSTIVSRNKSKYYVNLYDSYGVNQFNMPPYFLDGVQTYLLNGDGDTTEGTYFTPKTSSLNTQYWWKDAYYDFMPKPVFVNDNNDPVNGAGVLLFYNGKTTTRDNNGNDLYLQITDDIQEFGELNEGQPCWIWTHNLNNFTSVPFLPCFSRYVTNENGWVKYSWDFGTPKVMYVPDYTISDGSDIYSQYWQNYMRDMYDANTRVVECKVLLKERVVGEWLQRFYYFDGSYWIMNKIADYDVTSNDTTKCELIKVQDKNNYLT